MFRSAFQRPIKTTPTVMSATPNNYQFNFTFAETLSLQATYKRTGIQTEPLWVINFKCTELLPVKPKETFIIERGFRSTAKPVKKKTYYVFCDSGGALPSLSSCHVWKKNSRVRVISATGLHIFIERLRYKLGVWSLRLTMSNEKSLLSCIIGNVGSSGFGTWPSRG